VVVVEGLDIKNSNNFYPLNNKNNGNVNFYFGMRYDVSFTIGDYVGPMTYTFSGDDDLWVCLDGKVVLDLGGIHGAIEKTVDLWEVLLAKKNPTYDDKKDFLESNNENIKEKKRTHTITVLYMERGAYKSNCYMSFILPEPESSPIKTTPAPTKDVAITKKNNLTNEYIEGIEFTLYRSSTCQEEDKITNKKSNKEGNVIFNGLREGEYYIKETDFVDKYGNSYKENNTVYKLKITKDDHGNLQQSLFNLIEGKEESVDNNIIYNTPENGTLIIQKTVDSVDNIDKYASFTFKIESSKEKNNSRKNVVLYKTIVFNSQGTKTVIVKNLPFGEYTVTELSTINYKCTKPVVTKALKGNKEVVFEFNNEFNSSGGFFDTNVVVNKISIQDTVEGTDGQVKKKYNLEKILGDNSLVTNNE
ncbi:MAG: fibro-slime domain-containing protein, partial [Lachnospiraceae bacterium]|nr:fibro-slime domain-containing protein [Lachnospiraceae bacterium]